VHGSAKLEQLLSRIKSVNNADQRAKTERGPIRDNATLYLGSSRLKPTSMEEVNFFHPSSAHGKRGCLGQQTSTKSGRRQFIMEKFRHIESSLYELRQGEEPNTGIGSEILHEIQTLR